MTKDTSKHYRGWKTNKVCGENLGANKIKAIKYAKANGFESVMLYPGQYKGENKTVWTQPK